MSRIVVIAGPSGSGKNTVIDRLIPMFLGSSRTVTATTRSPRPGEVHGRDYYFMSLDEFDRESSVGHMQGKRFVPLFGGIHYGIFLPDLEEKMSQSDIVFASVDVVGMQWLKSHYETMSIFIMPESVDEFKGRLRTRNPEWSEQEYTVRLKIMDEELRIHAPQFDYRVINADGMLQDTVQQVVEILQKEGYSL